jgi:hypothetical protein
MNKNNILINSIRHASQIRSVSYLNSTVTQAYAILFPNRTAPVSRELTSENWRAIRKLADNINCPVELLEEFEAQIKTKNS